MRQSRSAETETTARASRKVAGCVYGLLGFIDRRRSAMRFVPAAWLRKKKIKSAIMHRALRNKPLTERQKLANSLISKNDFLLNDALEH